MLLSLSLYGSATAEIVPINNKLGYNKRFDPITDVNTSYMLMFEVNDQDGDTGFRIRCSDDGQPDIWADLFGKNQIMPYNTQDKDKRIWPDVVVVRLGTDAPFNVLSDDLYSVSNDEKSLGFDGKSLDRIIAGLVAGKKMVIRLSGSQFRQPLTYTFSAQGFATAWNGVKACK